MDHRPSFIADRTARNAVSSTSASTLIRAPSGKVISITPRRFAGFLSFTPGAGGATASEICALGPGNWSAALSTIVTGTNAIGSRFSGARRAPRVRRPSTQPSRARWIHLKTRLAFKPFRRATSATDAPGASACATIRRRNSSLLCRRPIELTLETSAPEISFEGARIVSGVHLLSSGHQIRFLKPRVGGRHATLTLVGPNYALKLALAVDDQALRLE